ncbi:cell division protein ZipA [Halomonas sp. PAMB 3232]|uniref:cell division protein ZipA n=1 Tax=Halomonas sp. PAMB 3232 TaxID=3075221 RepID=UPI00289DD7A4|nr:cell division protein ZipA [Halomonas sp. PAMB 3232]WNL39710.1 cell division protein ZipA [Halomonas sp. PAMB 3232]
MELREWLIILGLALVSLIVVDGVRRLQRQRRVPRLDQAVDNLPKASAEEFDDEAKEAEINWELPNGGARVVKPADYSGLGKKPQLERQEHPGPSRVLSDFKRSFSRAATRSKKAAGGQQFAYEGGYSDEHAESASQAQPGASKRAAFKASAATPAPKTSAANASASEISAPSFATDEPVSPAPRPATEPALDGAERQEPSLFVEPAPESSASSAEPVEPTLSAAPAEPAPVQAKPAPLDETIDPSMTSETPASRPEPLSSDEAVAASESAPAAEQEPVLRAEPEDTAAHVKSTEARKRRQLRAHTAGELDDDTVDEYRLVDFEGIGRSFKRRMIEHRQTRERKKAEKAERAKALAKQKAERKALEAEQRREAKEAAEAEKARIAQENARARELEAANSATRFENDELYSAEPSMSALRRQGGERRYDERFAEPRSDDRDDGDYPDEYGDEYSDAPAFEESSVRVHPTLAKALRHDVSGARARDALTDASEMVVISVLSRDEDGFDGGKLLELMMACGLRYCSAMGVFHRFETESDDSALQFSMVNVVKPGTFPIEQMDEFATPGVTFLMPLPGALDSAAAFEAMVETAMVVVRHMGGELKDENRSVMTAQTIEFARQRVHEFERRHRLQRHAR